MSEKFSEKAESQMADVSADDVRIEMSDLVEAAAHPISPREPVKSWIPRSAFRLGLSCGRAKRLLYQEARRIDAHEADNIRRRVAIMNERRDRQDQAAAKIELAVLRERLKHLKARLDDDEATSTRDGDGDSLDIGLSGRSGGVDSGSDRPRETR